MFLNVTLACSAVGPKPAGRPEPHSDPPGARLVLTMDLFWFISSLSKGCSPPPPGGGMGEVDFD
jgi:hypothetical protein